MVRRKVHKLILVFMIFLAITVETVLPVNAMTVYESNGNEYEEGYIFIGESHCVLAAHAVGMKADELGNTFRLGDQIDIAYEYCWDSSREVTKDGKPNTFTMKGNLFFVFEGNNGGVDDTVQTNRQYIYSDGNGKRGRGVEKIHEIINSNPNIKHWNIISIHGAVSASKGTKEIADYYVNSYRNWITYEFPQADCYFLSVATMTKYYKSTADKNIFNHTIKTAFPDQFLDYTDFYKSKSPQRMIDTIHWDDETYVELISDVLLNVGQKRQTMNKTQDAGATVDYAITEVQAVLYTNDMTVIYAQPTFASNVILPSCEAGLPVQVTGITDNGFFRICVSPDGTDSYVAGAGLSQQP